MLLSEVNLFPALVDEPIERGLEGEDMRVLEFEPELDPRSFSLFLLAQKSAVLKPDPVLRILGADVREHSDINRVGSPRIPVEKAK